MQIASIEVAEFMPEHLDGALALSRQAGWPHGLQDWSMSLSLGEGVVALCDGRVVGTALTTPFGKTAINMVIVDQVMRGHGIGGKLMGSVLKDSESRETRLIATQEGLPLYRKLGFRESGRIFQHQGVPVPRYTGADIRAGHATEHNLPRLRAMDHEACGMDRSNLIAWLVNHAQIAVLWERGEIEAFAGLREFGLGKVAGPAVARDAEDAKALFALIFDTCRGAFVRVDIPERSGLSGWLVEHGLDHVGGGIAMTRGGDAGLPQSTFHTFALASQAFG